MKNDLDIRLRTDKLFIEYLCTATGKSASAIAAGAGMAPTTLNRYLSKKIKLKSTLKDTTIQKIASTWGFDHMELMLYRQRIEEALRAGKAVPEFHKARPKSKDSTSHGFRETLSRQFEAPERDPLMDQIMGATYDVWFKAEYREQVAFERLPGLVRLLYGRARSEPKIPSLAEIRKRAADMLAVAAMEAKARKK